MKTRAEIEADLIAQTYHPRGPRPGCRIVGLEAFEQAGLMDLPPSGLAVTVANGDGMGGRIRYVLPMAHAEALAMLHGWAKGDPREDNDHD